MNIPYTDRIPQRSNTMPQPIFHFQTIALMAVAALITQPSAAQTINEDLKITASDAASNDRFGRSVAVSGTTAIVGAYLDDDMGSRSGAAYIFDTETGVEIFKLTAQDGAQNDEFGQSVAISGTKAIVGAWKDVRSGSAIGSAYIFDTVTGEQLFKLTASDAAAGDQFGVSVAISDTVAIVGARFDDDGGPDSGSAYIFDVQTGQQLHKLTASDATSGDIFGWSVAISGTTAIVGARDDDDMGAASGSAYLFDAHSGKQLFKLNASDGGANHFFGASVAISGTAAIVGANGNNRGAAYLFDIHTGIQLAKLTASGSGSLGVGSFGSSVAISGATVIVGASGDSNAGENSGAAYLFNRQTGSQYARITASDARGGDLFGSAVAVSGTAAIIGANSDDDAGTNSGSAYIFHATNLLCPADLTGDRQLGFLDISAFLTALKAQDFAADLTNDLHIDFHDISLFVSSYTKGCP